MLGWQNVREIDAISGIEDWKCTLEMVKDKNRLRNPLVIDDAGWLYCGSEQVYYGPYDKHNK